MDMLVSSFETGSKDAYYSPKTQLSGNLLNINEYLLEDQTPRFFSHNNFKIMNVKYLSVK